ncbi:MAG: hypothetical protein H3C62_00785 [Gemmatimonadaceae bacterium]|nr:hypothetical protein [Gemmatimonadaceae bacterium]
MSVRAFALELVAAEAAVLAASHAAADALHPAVSVLGTLLGEHRLPPKLGSTLALLSGDRETLEKELRTESLQALLARAREHYARPGLVLDIDDADVLRAIGAVNEWHNVDAAHADLVKVAGYLERTFGEGAGDRLAVQQLRAALRKELRGTPARSPRGVVLELWMYPDSYATPPRYDYQCRERARRTCDGLTRAFALLGVPADEHTLARSVAAAADARTIVSRHRTECGAGIAFVTFQRKLLIELPLGLGTEFVAWLDAVEQNVAA